MVLIDLRDGVEFARLGPSPLSRTWLPHVRALGLEFDADFSIAVLQWVLDRMSERAERLKATGTTTLGQYRHVAGQTIPRLLVVIDEFQRLFEGDDDQAATAASLIERIARTGRGFGIHLVLASQAITGIRGLAVKQDTIFGQFHNRISLRNTAVESQAFLAPHNLAATELEYRGQVVINDSLGAPESNRIGTVAHADEKYLEQLQARLFAQGHRAEPPSVFRASAFAQWPARSVTVATANGVTAAVGMPVTVEAVPHTVTLSRSPNQGLAVVGTDRSVVVPTLLRAAVTAAECLGPHPLVTILDADSDEETPRGWVAALVEQLTRRGAEVQRIGRAHIGTQILDLARRTDGGLVVAIALDSVDLATPM